MKRSLLSILMLVFLVLAQAKPHVAIAIFGPVDVGKTTLTSAITMELSYRGLAKLLSFDLLDCSPEEKEHGITIDVHKIEYETESRHYTHFDCPGYKDYTSKTAKVLPHLDGAIFVISATDGIDQQARELIGLAQECHVPALIVFINKCDMYDDSEVPDQLEKDIRVLLSEHGFDGENTPVIKGSALGAICGLPEWVDEVWELLDAMDSWIPAPVDQDDRATE